MHALTRKAGWLISLPRAEPFLYTPEVDLLHRDRHFRSPWFFYMSSQTKNFSCLNKDVLNLSIFSDDKSFHRERWKKAFRINFSFKKCLHFISLNVWYYLREIYLKRKSLIQPKKKRFHVCRHQSYPGDNKWMSLRETKCSHFISSQCWFNREKNSHLYWSGNNVTDSKPLTKAAATKALMIKWMIVIFDAFK